jgi:hypothetical protein
LASNVGYPGRGCHNCSFTEEHQDPADIVEDGEESWVSDHHPETFDHCGTEMSASDSGLNDCVVSDVFDTAVKAVDAASSDTEHS